MTLLTQNMSIEIRNGNLKWSLYYYSTSYFYNNKGSIIIKITFLLLRKAGLSVAEVTSLRLGTGGRHHSPDNASDEKKPTFLIGISHLLFHSFLIFLNFYKYIKLKINFSMFL